MADEAVRKQYAKLILSTVGNESGFSTCLSASAEAMRYRLKSIIKPRNVYSGAVIIGVLFFFLYSGMGLVGIAFEEKTGEQLIYQSLDSEEITIKEVQMIEPESITYECIDVEALHEYIENLSLVDFWADYVSQESAYEYRIEYDTPKGMMILYIEDHWVYPNSDFHEGLKRYYVQDGIDWEYLDTLLAERTEPDLHMVDLDIVGGYRMSTALKKLCTYQENQEKLLYESDILKEDMPKMLIASNCSEVELAFFGRELIGYTIEAHTMDGQTAYCLLSDELEEKDRIPILDVPAYYSVCASFYGPDQKLYEAEFQFNIEYTENN